MHQPWHLQSAHLQRCLALQDHITSTDKSNNKWSKKKGKKEFGNLQWAAHTLEAAEAGGPEQNRNRRTRTFEDTPQECLKDSRGVDCELWFEILGEFEDDDDEAERPCMYPAKGRAKKTKR